MSFPRFQKRSPKTRKQFWAREVRSPASFVDYLPPPSPSDRARIGGICIPPRQFRRCSSRGAKLAHAAASRDFCLGFFSLQNRAYSYPRHINKKSISIAPTSPPAPSSKPLDTLLLPVRPFSQRPSEGARGVCIVAHHVRGQGKDGRGGAARRSPSH